MKFFIFLFLIFSTAFLAVIFSFGLALNSAVINNYGAGKINGVKTTVLGISKEILEFPLSKITRISVAQGRLPENQNKILEPEIEPYNLEAGCGAVADINENKILYQKQADKKWPLASITKLMTALVFLDHNPGWDKVYEVRREDRREGGRIYLYTGEKVRVKDLFFLSLVGSANTATIGLVNSTGLSEEEFVKKMNEKAAQLGLISTNFYDPAGLSNNNFSTAKEIAKFTGAALSNKYISEATLTKNYQFATVGGRKKSVNNTDYLLDIFPQNGVKILGGKTGYLDSSGYCFVGKFVDHSGREMISVVLGGDTRNSRFMETRNLVEWAYENYVW